MPSRFEKFSEGGRRVLSLAQEEAQRLNHNYIGTEHILLGLMRETEGRAARVLANLSVDLAKVRSAVEFVIKRGSQRPDGIGLTQSAKKVVELAVDEARRLNHHYIGTVHLLIGLMREGEGTAAAVLESFGVTLEKVRKGIPQVSDRPRGKYRGPVPTTEWPPDLQKLAADLKRAQMMKDEAIFQQDYERAAHNRDAEFELDRRFEERYAEWARSHQAEPDPTEDQ